MDLGLAGRTAIVGASSGGLGRAIALALGNEGANVVVTGRDANAVRDVAGELPSAIAVTADSLDPETPALLIEAARKAFGPPDILVLNGPGPAPGRAVDLDGAGLSTTIDMLLRPHVDLVSRALPAMREAGWGRILAVGSAGVEAPIPGLVASNVGRAGLAAYLKSIAAEVAADGVTVNMLLPGRIATNRVVSLDEATAARTNTSVAEVRGAAEVTIPARRYGKPEEFGAVGAFLCSDHASYVTGSYVRCDGGLLANL